MPLRSNEEKGRFLRERQDVENVAEGWIFGAYASGGVAVLAPPTAIVAVPIGVICAAFAYGFKKRKAACDAIIDDPPRDDFRTRTRPQRGWFDPRRLDASLSEVQIRLSELLAEGDALLRAAVRADERAQGAYRVRQLTYANEQARESDAFLDAFLSLQPETAEGAEQVLIELRSDARWSILLNTPSPPPPYDASLDDFLPQEALRQLRQAGISEAS